MDNDEYLTRCRQANEIYQGVGAAKLEDLYHITLSGYNKAIGAENQGAIAKCEASLILLCIITGRSLVWLEEGE
jgi:hypothetical protein